MEAEIQEPYHHAGCPSPWTSRFYFCQSLLGGVNLSYWGSMPQFILSPPPPPPPTRKSFLSHPWSPCCNEIAIKSSPGEFYRKHHIVHKIYFERLLPYEATCNEGHLYHSLHPISLVGGSSFTFDSCQRAPSLERTYFSGKRNSLLRRFHSTISLTRVPALPGFWSHAAPLYGTCMSIWQLAVITYLQGHKDRLSDPASQLSTVKELPVFPVLDNMNNTWLYHIEV